MFIIHWADTGTDITHQWLIIMAELTFIQEQKFLHEDLASNYDAIENLYVKK